MRRLASIALVLAALAACAAPSTVQKTAQQPPAYRFTLTDQDGKRVTVGQLNGPRTALYFGFSHCKDTCPQTLSLLAAARKKAGLTPGQLRIVMVTVDPERDTPAKLKTFIDRVGVQALALTGPQRQLRQIYREYGVVVQPIAKNDIGHTDYIYLIGSDARLNGVVSPHTAVTDIAQRLRAL